MKKLELEPSKENIISTLKEDLFCRNEDLFRFAQLCDLQEDSCAISLNGKWGSGKTFFVRQLQYLMNACNDQSNLLEESEKEEIKSYFKDFNSGDQPNLGLKKEIVYYYDAWSNDNDVDPILSLIYQIAIESKKKYKFKHFTNVLPILSSIIAIIDFITGRNISNVVNAIENGLKEGKNDLDIIKDQKDLQNEISNFFDKLIDNNGDRLIIIIDELDRCRPDFAVKLLERVKHYFLNDRITFVFAINPKQLQYTIKKFYGEEFDASRYLDRFFDLRILLPKADLTLLYKNLQLDNSTYYERMQNLVISYFHFELREILRFYKSSKIAAGEFVHNTRKNAGISLASTFGLTAVVPILIGLYMTDLNGYEAFINGENSEPFISILGTDDVLPYYSSRLLDDNETFEKSDNNKKCVDLKGKLQQFYDAVFNSKRKERSEETRIGKFFVTDKVKDRILKSVTLISAINDYDI